MQERCRRDRDRGRLDGGIGSAKAFDEGFIELARSVYVRNDERAAVKRAINEKLGSTLVEEKSYQDYR